MSWIIGALITIGALAAAVKAIVELWEWAKSKGQSVEERADEIREDASRARQERLKD